MLHKILAIATAGEVETANPDAPITRDPIFTADDIGIPQVDADDNTVRNVLSYVFAAAGAISALMVIIGGIRYIISTGNPQQTSSAKGTIIYAIIGLIISLAAFALVNFIFNAVGSSPTAESSKHLAAWL